MEQLILFCKGNPNPRVGHHKEQLHLIVKLQGFRHFYADISHAGKLDGIGNQVIEDLRQAQLVPHQIFRDPFVHVYQKMQAFGIYRREICLHRVLYHPAEMEFLLLYGKFSCFQF